MEVFRYRGALPPGHPTFVGREEELSRIARLCRGKVESYVIVLGARQSGKTSLFYQLEARLGEWAQLVPVNLQGLPHANSAEVFHFIAQALAIELDSKGQAEEDVQSAPALKQLLCNLSPPRITVVTIDEIGAVHLQAARDLANALRSFHQDRLRSRYRTLRRYVFVLVGSCRAGLAALHCCAGHRLRRHRASHVRAEAEAETARLGPGCALPGQTPAGGSLCFVCHSVISPEAC